jgi:hypothetical protein
MRQNLANRTTEKANFVALPRGKTIMEILEWSFLFEYSNFKMTVT